MRQPIAVEEHPAAERRRLPAVVPASLVRVVDVGDDAHVGPEAKTRLELMVVHSIPQGQLYSPATTTSISIAHAAPHTPHQAHGTRGTWRTTHGTRLFEVVEGDDGHWLVLLAHDGVILSASRVVALALRRVAELADLAQLVVQGQNRHRQVLEPLAHAVAVRHHGACTRTRRHDPVSAGALDVERK